MANHKGETLELADDSSCMQVCGVHSKRFFESLRQLQL